MSPSKNRSDDTLPMLHSSIERDNPILCYMFANKTNRNARLRVLKLLLNDNGNRGMELNRNSAEV